jgi:hypothetical protein
VRFSRFSEAQPRETARSPDRLALQLRTDERPLYINTMRRLVFISNRMIFELTQRLEIASCRPDCVIYSQP